MEAYRALEKRFERLSHLEGVSQVLHWDRAVMMPPGGATARAGQQATLDVLAHEILVDPRTGDLLNKAEGEAASLDGWQAANFAEMRRRWRHATALPADLVEALTLKSAACEMAWREARAQNRFADVAPLLTALLGLVREKAQAKAAALGLGPYDALLDSYDPGTRSADVDRIFGELRSFLPGLIDRVVARQAALPEPLPLDGRITVPAQRKLARKLMKTVGFDTQFGRLDVSHHPFTCGVPDDVRITTRYTAGDFTESLMGVLHETGHALYERGRPPAWKNQPVGEARGMTIHESQSLLLEMQACRSREFVRFVSPLMREVFLGTGDAWSAANLERYYLKVERSLIRVEADEVTYPAHILLRYDLERALVIGDLQVKDLPGAWADGMKALLGIDVPGDALGCMQDIHWYGGDFGYFPTYTLGALAAAQLFQAAIRANTDVLPGIARGDFRPLLVWLGPNVHSIASRHSTQDILRNATGAPLGTAAFRAHVEARYLS